MYYYLWSEGEESTWFGVWAPTFQFQEALSFALQTLPMPRFLSNNLNYTGINWS